jgi:hypothetical protein
MVSSASKFFFSCDIAASDLYITSISVNVKEKTSFLERKVIHTPGVAFFYGVEYNVYQVGKSGKFKKE